MSRAKRLAIREQLELQHAAILEVDVALQRELDIHDLAGHRPMDLLEFEREADMHEARMGTLMDRLADEQAEDRRLDSIAMRLVLEEC
jgi:hypothetical protein